jgi:hypothetical protein
VNAVEGVHAVIAALATGLGLGVVLLVIAAWAGR